MPAFVCEVDTNILFMKDAYYIKFKDQQLKYIPGRKGLQDNIILKMNRRMTGEDAFSSITEFLSALSYSWSALFDTDGGFINNIRDFSWENFNNSAAGNRKISQCESREDFILIHPLQNEVQTNLARLYRMAMISSPVYSKILFLWHCLCYPEKDEREISKNIKPTSENNFHIENILKNPLLHKHGKEIEIGSYIYDCVRHSIAHINRNKNAIGKSLSLDSLQEIQHLSEVSDLLHTLVRKKMQSEYCMNLADDPNYICYFLP